MRCVGIAVLFMVSCLHLAGIDALAQAEKPDEPDTTTASDIYNPPRVITPEYEAGPRPSAGTEPGAEAEVTDVPEPVGPDTSRTAKSPCATCSGGSMARVGGGGEFSTGYLFANLDDINPQVHRMGIPNLSENIFMVGGRGYARIGRLIIGGAGYAGDTESSGVPDCCARYASLRVAYGGVILGLAMTRPFYEVMAGMLFGGGSVEIMRERNSVNVSGWDDAWEIFDPAGPDSVAADDISVTSKITGEFIALEPFVEIKYWLLPSMALDLSASYLNAEVARGKWKLDGESIPDSPGSNMGGWSLRLGLHLGV
jgi:hypothetical protein